MSATATEFAYFIHECSDVALTTLQLTIIEELRARLVTQRNEPTMAALLSRDRPLPETPARLRRSSRPPMTGTFDALKGFGGADRRHLRLVK